MLGWRESNLPGWGPLSTHTDPSAHAHVLNARLRKSAKRLEDKPKAARTFTPLQDIGKFMKICPLRVKKKHCLPILKQNRKTENTYTTLLQTVSGDKVSEKSFYGKGLHDRYVNSCDFLK